MDPHDLKNRQKKVFPHEIRRNHQSLVVRMSVLPNPHHFSLVPRSTIDCPNGLACKKTTKLTKNCNIQIEKLHKSVQRISPKNHSQTHTNGKRTKQLFPRRVPGCFLLLRLTRRAATPLARFRPIGRTVRPRGSALIDGGIRRRPGLGGHFFSHCQWSSTFFDRSLRDTVSNQRIQPGKKTRPMHVLKQCKKEKNTYHEQTLWL